MTQEEMIRQRQELVHTMFSSTGDEFVRLVIEELQIGRQCPDSRSARKDAYTGV